MTVPGGDPEFFASRKYIDADDGESETFLDQEVDAIKNCTGIKKIRQGRLKRAYPECGAHAKTLDTIQEHINVKNEMRSQERAITVYLTEKEQKALLALSDTEFASLSSLPNDQIEELVLFNRQHPELIEKFRSLAN